MANSGRGLMVRCPGTDEAQTAATCGGRMTDASGRANVRRRAKGKDRHAATARNPCQGPGGPRRAHDRPARCGHVHLVRRHPGPPVRTGDADRDPHARRPEPADRGLPAGAHPVAHVRARGAGRRGATRDGPRAGRGPQGHRDARPQRVPRVGGPRLPGPADDLRHRPAAAAGAGRRRRPAHRPAQRVPRHPRRPDPGHGRRVDVAARPRPGAVRRREPRARAPQRRAGHRVRPGCRPQGRDHRQHGARPELPGPGHHDRAGA